MIPSVDDAVEKSRVQQTMDRMVLGYERADVNVILSTYEADAAYIAQPGQTVRGADALRGLFEQFISSNPDFDFKAHDIVIAGDIALHLSRFDVVLKDGDGTTHIGLSVAVLRRQPNGEWLMVIDHPSGERLLQD